MKILVIGGTLYFGKVIVQSLLARGDEVTLYTRGNTKPEFWDECDHIVGDRTDHAEFAENLSGRTFDAVIDNLAYTDADVRSAISALTGRTSKYVVASTVSIYGGPGHAHDRLVSGKGSLGPADQFVDLEAQCPLDEDTVDLTSVPWDYDESLHAYAQGKRQIERRLMESADFPWVVMRVPATLGPEDPTLRFWWYQQRIEDGGPIVLRDGGLGVFRIGYRDDVASAFLAAVDRPSAVRRIYNLCQNEIPTLRHYLETVARACERPLNAVSVPAAACDALSDLPWSDWSFDPLSIPVPYVMSSARARRELEIGSTPMSEWVASTVGWYRDNPPADSAHYGLRDREIELAERWGVKLDQLGGAEGSRGNG